MFIFLDFWWFEALGPIFSNSPWKILSKAIPKSQFGEKHIFWKNMIFHIFLKSYFVIFGICLLLYWFFVWKIEFSMKNPIQNNPQKSIWWNLFFLIFSRVGDQNIGSFRCRLGWGTKTSGPFDAVKCSAGPTTCRANYSETRLQL